MEQKWWKEAVVYQVYWRSFNDTTGNGIGDLQGVIEKLDYIKSLGVDVIWVNPFFESPDKDNGYDISNYYAVMDKAGDMETFERLLEEVHRRDMKLIMDLVVNHTSDQHPWFKESRSSIDDPKRDWYIWKDPKEDGSAPNNWRSYFTPSTWEYDEKTQQYYFHSFAIEQPDLNWENPEVREEIYNMMRFWLDKGIDGFRMDVINLLAKVKDYPDVDEPETINYLGNNPGIHNYLKEMYREVLQHYDVFTVGEIPFVTPEDGLLYVGEDRQELNTLFHFEVCDDMVQMDLPRFKEIQKRWYEGMFGRGTNSQFLNNHDHTRMVTRFGNDNEYREESAKLLGTLIHTLPGIPYVFQGEEIGMTGIDFPSIEDYQDIAMLNKYNEEVEKGRDEAEVLEELKLLSRDNSRTPMQWDDSENAGFTTGNPWIKVNPNYSDINVRQAMDDKNSIFYYYQDLISFRKRYKVLTYGDYQPILEEHPAIYSYFREFEDEKLLIVTNMSDEETVFDYSVDTSGAELLLHNYAVENDISSSHLKPHEVRVYLWTS